MVEQARAATSDVPNLTFVANERSDLAVFADDSFDFVYTARVLQHMPTPDLAMAYIAEFVRVLRPGGVACFHVPAKVGTARRLASRRRLAVPLRAIGISPEWLYRRLGLHSMHLVAVTEDQVASTLARAGAREIGHAPDGFEERINNPGFFYVAVKP
jgi:SAM-dependent methyltransferase